MPAELTVFAIYCSIFACALLVTVKRFGSENSGGSPRWRNALGLLPQVVVMPGLLAASVVLPSWAAIAERTFVYVFASLLIFDFFALKLNGTMVAHHGVCLAGHAYAVWSAPEVFWYYFAAVAALEAGSGTSCIWWLVGDLYPSKPQPICDALYARGMSLSNALCVCCLLTWSAKATSLGLVGRTAPVLITGVLIYMRQIEMSNIMQRGRAACSTG